MVNHNPAPGDDLNAELRLIADMIHKTRQRVVDSGAYFLLWGLLVAAAGLADYLLLQSARASLHAVPWAIAAALGGLTSVGMRFRDERRRPYTSFSDLAYNSVWVACGVAFLVMFVLIALPDTGISEWTMYPLVALLAGIATFASGGIMEWWTLRLGGLVWWTAAILMAFVPELYRPLIFAVAAFPGYVLPGLLLKRQFRLEPATR